MNLDDPIVAARILGAIDRRIDAALERSLPRVAYGTIASVSSSTHLASVYLAGSVTASPGFRYPEWMAPAAGDRVRVILRGGDRYIDEVYAEPGVLLPRFVPLDSVSVPIGFASSSGDIGTTVLELTAIPTSAIAALVTVAFRHSAVEGSGLLTVGGYRAAPNRSTIQSAYALLCYGQATNAYSTISGLLFTGATNNRSIWYNLESGSAGTVFYMVRVYGYLANE